MGKTSSTIFYDTFSPRVIDAGDLSGWCSDMLEEVIGSVPEPLDCVSDIPYDDDGAELRDLDEACAISEQDLRRAEWSFGEDHRLEVVRLCLQAKADVDSNNPNCAKSVHECVGAFKLWKHYQGEV